MYNAIRNSLLIGGLVGVSFVAAAKGLPSGDEIAQRINARYEGQWVTRNLRMELTDRRGKTRVRETRGFRRYYGNDKRTVLFYLSPTNIRDTAFLTYDYALSEKDDDQWLYIPAARKVRRISSSDRGDYFLGTDFTYEDIKLESKVSITDYKRSNLGEAEVDGHSVYRIESLPVSAEVAKELGYSKLISYVDPEIWMNRKGEYWDVAGNLLKTIHIQDFRQVDGIWTAHRTVVENHKTGHKSVFIFSDVDYETEVDDSLFSQSALRRGL